MNALQLAIEDARKRYADLNPLSGTAEKEALRYLPGGNTRSVLHYEPFPLTMVSGEGAELTDLDGHRYVDFVGEYSAGLFGHSDRRIKAAINAALDSGIAMGAPMKYERTLAALLCERYPALDQVRFCNSGTEANLMALTTACAVTGRKKVLAFRDAYHGGVIKFPGGRCELNVPYDFVLVGFNDIEGAAAIIRGLDDELAAVIVEPILGAGGNIPGNREFLNMLRRCTEEVGALLIFDEIKTARLGAAGVHGMLDFKPDLLTLGKFIAGGLPTGAFGGRADLMARYDPRHGRGWNHAGTFNNNSCSMAAGCVAMGEVFTPKRGAEFLEWSEAFRLSLNEMFAAKDVPMYANGMGSMIAIHFSRAPTKKPTDITAGCQSLRPLLHMEMLLEGVLICKRGDFFLSLPMNETHLAKARDALEKFIDKYKSLITEVLAA
ncbi:MAG TPA: aminotransferase class III-fold pyridoxal phosphate-dependent enzyme [Woeseiaceae bacterium]|nr:aminotransferase class III-fold pyridoxal phosphate-dependent enzyme [Woeseiaceae bacterium]